MGGGKGGGGISTPSQPVNTTSTVTQSNLPDYAAPYFQNILSNAQSLATSPYQPYTGSQLAPFNSTQNQAVSTITNNQGSFQPYFNAANSGLQNAQNVAQNTQFNPQATTNTYTNPQNFQQGSYTNPGTAQSYMSPYIQQALNPTLQYMNQQFGIQQTGLNSQAAGAGAYGGSGNALQQSQAQYNQNLALANVEAQGLQGAYTTGANQFNTEQGLGLSSSQAANQNAQMAAQLGMSATGANNQWNLAQGQLGLQGGQLGLSTAQGQAGLGQAQQAAYQSDANALMGAGSALQNQSQSGLNIAYQNYLNQQYYPYQQLNWESGILHGVPVTANMNVTGYQSPPSTTSTIAGLGLGAAGLSQLV